MTWKDKLEIGLKEDAPYRRDNLPAEQVKGPQKPETDDRSPEVPSARDDENEPPVQPGAEPPAATPRSSRQKAEQ